MGKLVDAGALEEAITKAAARHPRQADAYIREIRTVAAWAGKVPEAVTRCGDCRYWNRKLSGFCRKLGTTWLLDPEFFCAYGRVQ